ncbi:MAG: cell surface protein SprA [Candidatus Marinimicrobia bacterium]|nr:cell surface protein SprA [Candidatus Neomarinimicrobiota bacterium]
MLASLFFIIGINFSFTQSGDVHSFSIFDYDYINDSFTDPFKKYKKSYLYKGDSSSTGLLLRINNKLRKYKRKNEVSLIDGCFMVYEKHGDIDIKYPVVISYDYYKPRALNAKFREKFHKEAIKRINQISIGKNYGSKSLTLVSQDIAGTNLALNIDGNISISGKLIFEDKDLVNLNSNESKSWDLDINQTQRFNVEGKVGDKLTVKVKQDSEADFDWQNNMTITYDGEDNQIIQEVQAGNISLNLPSTQFVNVGSGKSEGLFGIKMVNRFGPLEMQGIVSRQKVKKASQTFSPGESSSGSYITDYNFIKDRYFFIDESFKNNYYPLNEDLQHIYYPEYVVYKFELFKRVVNVDSGIAPGVAYLNPSDESSYKEEGAWIRLEQGVDYEIDQILGYVRFKSLSSQDIVGISYEIGTLEGGSISPYSGSNPYPTNTIFYDDYLQNLNSDSDSKIKMKLIKAQGQSTPNSPTWPLMFKNVYALGGSNINLDELDVEIAYVGGTLEEQTHSEINNKNSFLSLFKLDSKDQNGNNLLSGDGIIDSQFPSIVNAQYGELFFPAHLPFAYEQIDGNENPQWGTNVQDIGQLLNTPLNVDDDPFSIFQSEFSEGSTGPAMYFSTNSQTIIGEHEFIIKVKNSQSLRSSSIDLGFMIVEGSETVRLNGRSLIKGTDYSIDYFTGSLNLINQEALDPTANLEITYEENELLSFDQKLLAGLHFKYDYSDNDYFNGGLYYYNQSIVDERVDFGYEPMRNFIWNLSGKYDRKLPALTDAVNVLPFIDTNKPSSIFLEGEYAQVSPNPNPIGEAFLDDFESSKRTSSPSIIQRYWKKSSPPILEGDLLLVGDRGKLDWYNPFVDISTQDIWPQQEVSNEANNTTAKIIVFQTDDSEQSKWNGITTQLYSSDFDQSQSKYLDIWLNDESVEDSNMVLNIDIGFISEDMNNNGLLDSEDEDIYGPGLGDGILSDSEDVGLDGCPDQYEDGLGGCTCDYPDLCTVDDEVEGDDPNDDNWYFEQYSDDYSQINGTEGNGLSSEYRYPDSEDLDNDNSLDIDNDYFTYKLNLSSNNNLENQTYYDSGLATGWKLYRILLSEFSKNSISSEVSAVDWDEVRSMRLWVNYDDVNDEQLEFSGDNMLKIAKIDIVGNEWKELGKSSIDNIAYDSFEPDSSFAITVINTQDNSSYFEPPGVQGEYDQYTGIRLKEQSLVLDFYPRDNNTGGIEPENMIAIKKVLTNLNNDNKNNFFAYNFMEMFVYGSPIDTLDGIDWVNQNLSDVDLLFRLGKDDQFYELRQPIKYQWDSDNHIKINMDELTRYKLNIKSLDTFEDTGKDGVFSLYENGCFDNEDFPYGGYLEEDLYLDLYSEAIDNEGEIFFEYISDSGARICGPIHWDFYGPGAKTSCDICTIEDPNGDDFKSVQFSNPFLTVYNPKEDDQDLSINSGLELDGKWQQGEPLEDYNGNNIFDYPAEYNSEENYWFWDDSSSDIEDVCNNCSEFIIKGEPAINRIEYITVGVVNNADNKVYGKVYINELRLTGVKKEKGEAFRLKTSLDFSNLLSVNAEYKNEDADFHRLEERLGTGDSEQFFSLQSKFNPDLFLPSKWGLKVPLNVSLSSMIRTPKYYPSRPDVLTQGESQRTIPDSIKSINRTLSFSTSFNKSTKSDNWILRSTLDRISLNYSVIKKRNSSVTINEDKVKNTNGSINYSYNFDKGNYVVPFKKFKEIPLIGESISNTKFYFSPEKLSTSMNLSEANQNKMMRSGTETNTYDLSMSRAYSLDYKFTDNVFSRYKKNVSSDLDFFMDKYSKSKTDLFKSFSPGLVKSLTEDLNNSFSPDILDWLSPSFKYNPYYKWNINNESDENPSATVENKTYIESVFNFNPKDFIGVFYKPQSSSARNNRTGRNSRNRSTNKSEPIFKDIENEFIKKTFEKLHSYASRISKITFKYSYNTRHNFSNIDPSQFIDYNFRLGLTGTPEKIRYSQNDRINSYAHDFDREFKMTLPTLTFVPNVSITNIEFKNKTSKGIQSASLPDSSRTVSFLPLGVRGDEGFPMISWGVTWNGLEKNKFIKEYFKTFKFSHNYKGQMVENFIDEEIQRKDFSINFSPLIKLDARTKGANPIRLELSLKHSVDIDNEGTSTERVYKNGINSKIEFSRSDGMVMPFFGRLSNTISFALNVDWEQNYTLLTTQIVNDLSDFNTQSRSTVFSFKPNLNYNFTKYVNGTVFYNYILTNDLTTGKTKENDFGFTINIKIQG